MPRTRWVMLAGQLDRPLSLPRLRITEKDAIGARPRRITSRAFLFRDPVQVGDMLVGAELRSGPTIDPIASFS